MKKKSFFIHLLAYLFNNTKISLKFTNMKEISVVIKA